MSDETPEELQGEIVFTTTAEYIQGASVALATVSELDPMIMNKADELRVKRIKRKAIKIIETEFSPTTERDEILQFIKESDRGIMKGYLTK